VPCVLVKSNDITQLQTNYIAGDIAVDGDIDESGECYPPPPTDPFIDDSDDESYSWWYDTELRVALESLSKFFQIQFIYSLAKV